MARPCASCLITRLTRLLRSKSAYGNSEGVEMKSFRCVGAQKAQHSCSSALHNADIRPGGTSTHCMPEEQVIFSCSVGKKVVSICASDTLGPTSGRAQYRFGALGKIELKIPAQPQHPTTFSRLGVMRGPAWVDTHIRVVNGEYAYTVYEGEGRDGSVRGCWSLRKIRRWQTCLAFRLDKDSSPKSSTRIAKPSLMKRKIRWTRGSIQ